MVKEENKFGYGIKGKLTSAVAMLLVAVIMVVSSTYAWFTLSTAPEVTGITTAVGANGALEMLLATKDADGKWLYNNGQVSGDPNTYWGNLVNLTGNAYGQQKITLYPSVLYTVDDSSGVLKLGANPLSTPTYGPDGRVSGLANNALYGIYNTVDEMFYPAGANDYGFRGVGVASGMTPRQLAFREARSQVTTLMARARNTASDSLTNNGSTLANLAIKKAMLSSALYSNVELQAIDAMISDLRKSLENLEEAYMQAFYALAASSKGGTDETYTQLKTAIASKATLSEIVTALETAGVTVPDSLKNGITLYNNTVTAVNEADAAFTIDTSIAKTDYVWNDFNTALYKLVDMDNIIVCDVPANQINQGNNKDKIVDAALGAGVVVTMATGGGVYANIADQTGDYKVDIKIDLSPVGANYQMGAKMNTATTVKPVYLQGVFEYLSVADMEPVTGDTKMPLTEFYGYVIDLAFRTNAAQSNLLLQQEGVDRIYKGNQNSETMGAGSTMTFASADINFSNAQVKALMENIRIVFFNTKDNSIYAYAKLDMTEENVTTTADGVTAYMYLYKTVKAYKTADDAILFAQSVTDESNVTTTKYYSDYACTTEVTGVDATKLTEITTEVKLDDAKITELKQNAEVHVSALVYLDGNTIDNSDVAASVAQSMTGKMNLQFASDATLVPMEYGELHQTGAEAQEIKAGATYTPTAIENATWAIKGTAPTGVSIAADGTVTVAETAAVDTKFAITATVGGEVVKEINFKVVAADAAGT